MSDTVQPSHNQKILADCDVLVCGGGPAGCAAAVTAARQGCRVILAEKDGTLGGAAVSQNVIVILSSNRVDFQGVWHEFMAEIMRLGGADPSLLGLGIGVRWTLDPVAVQYAWLKLLCDAGVRILFHTDIIDVLREGDTVTGVLTASVSGRSAILARRVIDCTGDGLVCHYAGCDWKQGDNDGHKYAMALTKVVRLGGIGPEAGVADKDEWNALKASLDAAVSRGEYTTPLITTGRVLNYIQPGHSLMWRLPKYRNEVMLVTSRILETDPLDTEALSRAEITGMEQMYEVADFYRRYVPGCENSFLSDVSRHVGVRSSRRVVGIATASDEDATLLRHYPDGIAKSSWGIDVWPADSYTKPANAREAQAERAAKIEAGDWFDIRYGCLVPAGVDNLLMAGRIISAGHLAEASLRIQQTCMATGEAAGLSAALSLEADTSPRRLDPMNVVRKLEELRSSVKEINWEEIQK